MLNKILLLAAHWQHDLDLVADLGAQSFGQQLPVRDRMRDQDQARRRPVVVELREESGQDLLAGERTIGLGKGGAGAPILAGAEEETLDAGESTLLIGGKHVGLLDAARIDALMRLNRGKRGEAIAVD